MITVREIPQAPSLLNKITRIALRSLFVVLVPMLGLIARESASFRTAHSIKFTLHITLALICLIALLTLATTFEVTFKIVFTYRIALQITFAFEITCEISVAVTAVVSTLNCTRSHGCREAAYANLVYTRMLT